MAKATSRPGRALPKGRMDVVHSLAIETPHVKWANPYSRGPVRAWLMPDVIGGRDVIELAQRLALEYDTLTLDKGGYNTWGFGDFYGRRGGPGPNYEIDYGYLVEDLAAETHYDVLVLPGTHPWHELPAAAREAIVRRVAEGGGLVLVGLRCDPEQLDELAELSPLLPTVLVQEQTHEDSWKEAKPVEGGAWNAIWPHFITAGVPLEALPTERMSRLRYRRAGNVIVTAGDEPLIAVKQYGEGRVVALGWDNLCFSPRVGDPWGCELAYPYEEYYYSLLCRALVWAANREPEVRLASVEVADGAVRAVIEEAKGRGGGEADRSGGMSRQPRPVTVEVTFRDERYAKQTAKRVKVTAPGPVEVPIPAGLNGGLQFADVIVRGKQGTFDWGTATFSVPRRVEVRALRVERDVVQVGDQVSGEVTLTGVAPRVTIELRCEDNHARVLDRTVVNRKLTGGLVLPYSLSTKHCLTRLGRVICEVRAGRRVLDRRAASLFVRTPQVWDDYEIIMDRFLPEPAPGRWPEIEKQLAGMNVSTMGAISPAMAEHVNFKLQADVVAYGFHPRYYQKEWNRSRKAYIATRDKQHLVRRPCFSTTEFRHRFREDLTNKVTSFARFSPISYYAYEEPSLTHYRGGMDLCWCPSCLSGFRGWLQETYRTLEALNREWGSDYTAWEQVVPLTTEEAQAAGRYAPWADFRTYMEIMWADTYRLGRDVIRGLDPHAVICLSGNQVGTPYNGYDYSRINRYVDQMQLYGSENLDEFNRSFYKEMLCTGCTGYGISDPYLALQLWGWLLNGNTAGVVIFWEISCVNPDLTLCKSGRDLARHFGELRGGGIARMLSSATREHCGIAIHYSYPSFHGTWTTDGQIVDHEWANLSSKAFGLMNLDRIAWTQLLEGLGYQYDFVSYGQVEDGHLQKAGYKLLILPDSVALSEKEAKEIEAFVAAGGIVISDIWPGVMNEHCTWRQGGALDALFGIAHGTLRPEDFRALQAGERVRVTDAERGWCDGHPSVTHRRHGRGEAIYLGQSLAPLFSGRGVADRNQLARLSDLAAKLMQEARLVPPARIANAHGQPALSCESAHYHAGAAEYFGIVRYPDPAHGPEEVPDAAYVVPLEDARTSLQPDDGSVHIEFPETRHIYDVRGRHYLGYTDRIDTKLGYGDARVYARLPYRVTDVEVSGPKVVAPGEAVEFTLRVVTSSSSEMGDHVAAVWVYAPDGTHCQHYDCRVSLPQGRGAGSIPLALSDPAGEWRVVVRDVASGREVEWGLDVR